MQEFSGSKRGTSGWSDECSVPGSPHHGAKHRHVDILLRSYLAPLTALSMLATLAGCSGSPADDAAKGAATTGADASVGGDDTSAPDETPPSDTPPEAPPPAPGDPAPGDPPPGDPSPGGADAGASDAAPPPATDAGAKTDAAAPAGNGCPAGGQVESEPNDTKAQGNALQPGVVCGTVGGADKDDYFVDRRPARQVLGVELHADGAGQRERRGGRERSRVPRLAQRREHGDLPRHLHDQSDLTRGCAG